MTSMNSVDLLIPSRAEMDAAAPPMRLTISEWAERHRVLTSPPSEEPGPLRLSRTPYLVPIMDACKSSAEQIVICKSAQIAGTECALSIIGYYAHQEPCSIMLVMADQDTATYMSRERIQRMFETSPELASIFDAAQAAKGEITLRNGTYIALGWASSVARLASRPMKIVCLDEVDKPGYYVSTREADPISLAIERTETYYNRKIVMLSTPTFEDGNIWRNLQNCDLIYDWHVPCPKCGQFQPLRWSEKHATGFEDGKYRSIDGSLHRLGGVRWESGRDATKKQVNQAGYECGECGHLWNTIEKNHAVGNGQMIARQEYSGKARKIGFHLNRLYSLLGRSGDIPKLVADWIAAVKSKDQRKIQGFINSSLAEPYRYFAQDRQESAILDLRDDRPIGSVPSDEICGLTCGADTQDNGFYYTIYAWGRGLAGWLVRDGFVDSLELLWPITTGLYYDISGAPYHVQFLFIDAMGHRTSEVYEWCRTKGQVRPIKGEQNLSSPYAVTDIDRYPGTNRPIVGGLKLYRLNTTYYKNMLHNKLSIPVTDPGGIRFHADVQTEFAKQMISEYRDEHGIWVCPAGNNHFWDCTYMALAAADVLGMSNWKQANEMRAEERGNRVPHNDGPRNPYTGRRANPFTSGKRGRA